MLSSQQDFQPPMALTHASMNGTGVDNGTPTFLTEAQPSHNSTPAPVQWPANSVSENCSVSAGSLSINYFPQIPEFDTRNPLLDIQRPTDNVEIAISNIHQNHGKFTDPSNPQQQWQPLYPHQNISHLYPAGSHLSLF
ncbi:hypothetical protein K505DRAFT_324513 [Melanomma pulvis-pyrius CBS 109.77]|uniref:Uncharacterized protein n=1 Tax=Melanomma pulvis-pyrius CBS 109.77 TaxID=1314802 RepID=A0A6A6XEW3_9PLEO|nr:hypothetical protein K505DRAFT_324513 [Melanomma pulvis-pyrius CBS 109.77]